MNSHLQSSTSQQTHDRIHEESAYFQRIAAEVSTVIVGNQPAIDGLLIAILSNANILLEGVPGVAKTTMIKAIAQALNLDFKRIQFTPDLLPSDLIGTMIYNQKTEEFETKKGPVFTNIVLADEINRAPAKVQSALLEAMQEHQVTIGNETFILDEPFFVFATQNPIEQEGTYRLPEAQVDRFIGKLMITYPTASQEREIIARSKTTPSLNPVATRQIIRSSQELVRLVYVDEKIVDYIIQIIFALREPATTGKLHEYIASGPSPRGTLSLYQAAQAHAFLKRRYFVTPDDVKAVAHMTLRHRVTLSYQADVERITADSLISHVLTQVKAP